MRGVKDRSHKLLLSILHLHIGIPITTMTHEEIVPTDPTEITVSETEDTSVADAADVEAPTEPKRNKYV
jgi:hypothetical protein